MTTGPDIFRAVVHQIITTGASGLSLPPRKRSLADAELIEIFSPGEKVPHGND